GLRSRLRPPRSRRGRHQLGQVAGKGDAPQGHPLRRHQALQHRLPAQVHHDARRGVRPGVVLRGRVLEGQPRRHDRLPGAHGQKVLPLRRPARLQL
ncbi:hypothetical protein BN1708_019472, partial [Verticillium longisporum]